MKKSGEVVVSPLRSIFLIFLIKHGFIAISAEQDVRHPFRGCAHLLTDDFLVNVGGAFKILDNAKKCADQNPVYKVFDADGNVVYEPKAAEPAEKVPFLVKVSISDLNIKKRARD